MATVSVIIVNWNTRELLTRCLTALLPCPHEVIVVDNRSIDGSAEYVEAAFPGVTLVRAPVNLGFAGAVNFASRRVAGEYLLLLGTDVAVQGRALDTMTALLESRPECGAVAGRIEDGTGHTPPRVRRLPTLATLSADLVLRLGARPHDTRLRRPPALPAESSAPVAVEQPSMACLMLRRSAFESVGRMDEAFYPAWFDDADLCRRLRTRGWTIVLEPSAVFHRLHAGASKRQLGWDTFTRIRYRNLQRYVRKHYGLTGTAIIKTLIVVGMCGRIVSARLRGDRASAATFRHVMKDVVRPRGYARLIDQLAEPRETAPREVV